MEIDSRFKQYAIMSNAKELNLIIKKIKHLKRPESKLRILFGKFTSELQKWTDEQLISMYESKSDDLYEWNDNVLYYFAYRYVLDGIAIPEVKPVDDGNYMINTPINAFKPYCEQPKREKPTAEEIEENKKLKAIFKLQNAKAVTPEDKRKATNKSNAQRDADKIKRKEDIRLIAEATSERIKEQQRKAREIKRKKDEAKRKSLEKHLKPVDNEEPVAKKAKLSEDDSFSNLSSLKPSHYDDNEQPVFQSDKKRKRKH
jgi:hypothetical protein